MLLVLIRSRSYTQGSSLFPLVREEADLRGLERTYSANLDENFTISHPVAGSLWMIDPEDQRFFLLGVTRELPYLNDETSNFPGLLPYYRKNATNRIRRLSDREHCIPTGMYFSNWKNEARHCNKYHCLADKYLLSLEWNDWSWRQQDSIVDSIYLHDGTDQFRSKGCPIIFDATLMSGEPLDRSKVYQRIEDFKQRGAASTGSLSSLQADYQKVALDLVNTYFVSRFSGSKTQARIPLALTKSKNIFTLIL